MMLKKRRYEILFLLSSREEISRKGLEDIRNLFSKQGVDIDRELDMGVKELSYPVKKQAKGHYFALYFEAETQLIKKMVAELRLNDAILRLLLVELRKAEWDFLKEPPKVAEKPTHASQTEGGDAPVAADFSGKDDQDFTKSSEKQTEPV